MNNIVEPKTSKTPSSRPYYCVSGLVKKAAGWVKFLRPHQYVKNGFIWLPLFFGHKLLAEKAIIHTSIAFGAFCLLASCVYIFNDIRDIEFDRHHPLKKERPLASGVIGRTEALLLMFFLLLTVLVVALNFLSIGVQFMLGAYLILNLLYSLGLKHRAILDVICIALGFVIRVVVGGFAARVEISHWIIMLTFLLALFIALGKRYDDLIISLNGHQVRKSVDGYNSVFISAGMVVVASVTIVAYILYTVSPEIMLKHGTRNLYITALGVIYGILRYLQIVFVEKKSGSPTRLLFKDVPLQLVLLLWLASCYFFIYC